MCYSLVSYTLVHMDAITLTEFRMEPSRWMDLAHEGMPLLITKHGKPHAVLTSPNGLPMQPDPPANTASLQTEDHPDVTASALRRELANILYDVSVLNRTYFVTSHGKRVAVITTLSSRQSAELPPAVERPAPNADDLPGMWEDADMIGGETDNAVEETPKLKMQWGDEQV